MRSLYDMDTIQIEITNVCRNQCSNCTRFVKHVEPYFMPIDEVRRAIDSMKFYPKMTGIQGGEPLLHPEFKEICKYAARKISRKRLGLWTTFPEGLERYRDVIVSTFGSIFLNDHSRPDVYHHPFLVAAEELVPDPGMMYIMINRCFFQDAWSASINPKGAYFCEIAASLAMLFKDSSSGWPVEPGWWWRTPKDFREQIEHFCPKCGGAMRLKRRVSSCDFGTDDISPGNFERIKNSSPRIKSGQYEIHDLQMAAECDVAPMASYKDGHYRDKIAARYGVYLTLNPLGFNEPHLMAKAPGQASLLKQYREKYGG